MIEYGHTDGEIGARLWSIVEYQMNRFNRCFLQLSRPDGCQYFEIKGACYQRDGDRAGLSDITIGTAEGSSPKVQLMSVLEKLERAYHWGDLSQGRVLIDPNDGKKYTLVEIKEA